MSKTFYFAVELLWHAESYLPDGRALQ